jgi:hypothetical protein
VEDETGRARCRKVENEAENEEEGDDEKEG